MTPSRPVVGGSTVAAIASRRHKATRSVRILAPSALSALVLFAVVLFALPLAVGADAQSPSVKAPTAEAVLDRAIGYHDPNDVWSSGAFRMTFRETRPSGPDRRTVAVIDNGAGRFAIETNRDNNALVGELDRTLDSDEICRLRINGVSDPDEAAQQAARWTCDRLRTMRDYTTYLWGLPMKLRDPGTHIDTEVRRQPFEGRDAWSLRVTYDEGVGDDIWYVYFDPQSGAMIGYRFYHDEAANDGEVIVLEGEVAEAGLRLPKSRAWRTHKDDRYLGTDVLTLLEDLTDN